MNFGLKSLRGRIIAVSLLLVGCLFGAAFYTQGLVNQSTRANQLLLARQKAFSEKLTTLKATLYNAEIGLYQYAALLDESQRESVAELLSSARSQAGELDRLDFSRSRKQIGDLAADVVAQLTMLEQEANNLLKVIGHVDQRFPASPIFSGHTYPANLRFITAVENAIADTEAQRDGVERDHILGLLKELRYQWAQQVSVVRIYIANRSGVFGMPEAGMRQHLANRDNYLQKVRILLKQLKGLDEHGKLGLLQSESLAEMRSALADFEVNFKRVVEIYRSGNWRADIPLLRNTIRPRFAAIWQLVNHLDDAVARGSSNSVMQVLDMADTSSWFLWLTTIFTAGVLLVAVFAYEYLIRRPLYQVVYALEALGSGGSYSPVLKTRTKATGTLVRAFLVMQQRVYSREMRLAAILDNASEGIINIGGDGIIRKFNNAAELLFGYSRWTGRSARPARRMPQPVRDEHDQYIKRYLESGEARIIGSEVNVTAQRKDGTVFPMSIKLSDMVLEGGHYFTAIVSDISERKAMLDHLRHLAEHDSLTGLYNRQYFTEELERVVERSVRHGGLNCALLYVDLDNFKYVNDTLGHLAGDRVLIEIANILTKHTRKSDIIARLGGDEFAVLLYDVDEAKAVEAAERYRQQVVEYKFRHDGKVIDVGCSLGVAMFEVSVESKEELMARADISCHMAKRAGRNSVHLYRADDRVSMDTMYADMGWARTIKEAIENHRFAFALQPIVDICDYSRVSYELLLRMRDSDGQLIMPAGFMPSAERFGLILEIDRWVVAHGIEVLAWFLTREPDARLSINLSAMSVGDEAVLRLVTEGLHRHGVEPERLCFEITETIAIADLAAAAEFMERLRALGCHTALDDFGVGYCSFAYLKDLPVDYVKIDGSFVRDISNDNLQLAMVKSMNEIAHAMGKQTVAEFVEDERVLAMLRSIGVDYVQGYLTGRPQLAEWSPQPGPTEASYPSAG